MSSVYPSKFSCKNHRSSKAEVVCGDHHRFLCMNCLIARDCGQECPLQAVSEMQKKRQDVLLLDLVNLHQIAESKLEARQDTEQSVAAQKETIANEMDEECDALKQKLEELKEANKKQMMEDLDKHLARTEREKTSLNKAVGELQESMGQLLEGGSGGGQIKPGSQAFQNIIHKRERSERVVSQCTDYRKDGDWSFQLASHLSDIKAGRKKGFGKAMLVPSKQ